ncbi:hypothetical protein PFICI_14816 [Pestalotiopsis fici W106-1]|uniref:Mid2 domain-containing protein n=1 Tax=Pestalotiopsis fici (strain W106-1 / CGMCC3.15140) TaxID=1229662 RepID=W3WIW5_PESFW|nr:uncharacterized protein PFICI_14816 [Pestalotiopsis fici W106-1]ETS73870.1 hypothetical protein PFICI_14816 [Pestalotiopsis fici W106-1]
MWLAWLFWSFLLIASALPRDGPAITADDRPTELRDLQIVEVERRIPEPIIVTITLTTTISLVPPGYSTAPMTTHTPIPWTVPGGSLPQITITRSRTPLTSTADATSITPTSSTSLSTSSEIGTTSTSSIGVTSSAAPTTAPSTSSTTLAITTSSSDLKTTSAAITPSSSSPPIPSDPSPSAVEGTSATTSSSAPGTSTALAPAAGLQGHSLAPGQIAAVVVGAIAFTIFVSVVAYLVRFAVIRRRQSSAEKRQRLDGEDAATAQQRYYQGGGAALAAAAAAANRSRSLHEGEFRIVIRTPPPAAAEEEEQRMRQLWPSPPGGTQRFTFFSGRSTTTATDSATDRGQWSQGTENGSSGRSHGNRNS